MTWSVIQSANNNSAGTSVTTLSKTISAVGSGNVLVVSVVTTNAVSPTITDNKSNTYNLAKQVNNTFLSDYWTTWVLGNITNGPTSVTINLSTAGIIYMYIDEFNNSAGATASNPVDVTAGTFSTSSVSGSNSVASGNATTTVNGDLIYGSTFLLDLGTPQGLVAGTGFTLGNSGNDGANSTWGTEWLVQGTAGSIQSTFTPNDTSGVYARGITMIALKPPGVADILYSQICL